MDCEGGLLFFLMFDHRIRSDRSSLDGRCVDWLELSFPLFNENRPVETWGNLDDFYGKIPFRASIAGEEIYAEFHTNSQTNDCGFLLYTLCFNPRSVLPENETCIVPEAVSRRKRSVDEITEEIFSEMVCMCIVVLLGANW